MEIEIGAFDAEKRAVPVVFTEGDVIFKRDVNACVDADGAYDEEATTKLVTEQVAAGVAVKISLGVIKKAEPDTEVPPEEPAADQQAT